MKSIKHDSRILMASQHPGTCCMTYASCRHAYSICSWHFLYGPLLRDSALLEKMVGGQRLVRPMILTPPWPSHMRSAITEWWNSKNRDCRYVEQNSIQHPLLEVMLMEREDRLKVQVKGSYKYLLIIWDRYKQWVVPTPSPVMSFIHCPMF